MSHPTTSETAAGSQSIGEILLAHGFVTQQQLDQALGLQGQSGKPIGQILVESDAITRLELATALSEQWSSSGEWVPTTQDSQPEAADVAQGPDVEDDTWSMAVPSAGVPEAPSVGALAERRLEVRLETVEAALAEIRAGEREDIGRLEDAAIEAARRVAALEPALGEIEQRVDSSAGAEELRGVKHELESRLESAESTISSGTAELGQLAGRLADATQSLKCLEQIDTGLAEAAGRLEALESFAPELRQAVDTLAALPAADPAFATRVEDIAARVDSLPDFGELVEELRGEIAEIGARPPGDPQLADALEALAARVDELPGGAELEALRTSGNELTARIDELSEPIAALADKADLDELGTALEKLAERPPGDPELAGRVDALAARLAGLADVEALGELRTTLDELAARPTSDAELIARVDTLASQLETATEHELVRDLQQQVEALTARLDEPADTAALDALREAVDELAERVAGFEDTETTEKPAPAPDSTGLETRLEELGGSLEELQSTVEASVALQAALEERIDAVPVSRAVTARTPGDASKVPEGIEGELERILMAIERFGLRIGEHDRALKELMQMQRRGNFALSGGTAPGGSSDLSPEEAGDVHMQVRVLAMRLEDAEQSLRADRDRALAQIERVASSLTWRVQRLEGEGGAGDASPSPPA